MDEAIDTAKADPYKTVYVIADSSSQTATDIKNIMDKYDPPTISGESTGYLCGNIPNSRVGGPDGSSRVVQRSIAHQPGLF